MAVDWWYLRLFIISSMSHICAGCHLGYPSTKGLERHENTCSLLIEQQSVPENAHAIYEKKKKRRQQQRRDIKHATEHQALNVGLPLLDLPYVCYFCHCTREYRNNNEL